MILEGLLEETSDIATEEIDPGIFSDSDGSEPQLHFTDEPDPRFE